MCTFFLLSIGHHFEEVYSQNVYLICTKVYDRHKKGFFSDRVFVVKIYAHTRNVHLSLGQGESPDSSPSSFPGRRDKMMAFNHIKMGLCSWIFETFFIQLY